MSDLASLTNEAAIVNSTASPSHSISRWSDKGINGHPALVTVPESEHDILAAISYARENALQVLPAGGGHGSFVEIGSKTLYLDLKRFNQIKVNEAAQTVRVGGGVVTGELIKTLTDKGFYTTWTNSDAVGVVGSILGGGNPTMCGLHGMMIDQVLSVRLITADGRILELSSSSIGDELALFHAICGAGFGLGVITFLELKVFPMENLRLSMGCVWVRKLIFPASEIEVAVDVFDRLQPPTSEMVISMVFVRAPPTAPNPGAAMIVLTATYYGPHDEAQAALPILFKKEIVAKAIVAATAPTPLSKMNEPLAHFDVHGGFKDIQSAAMNKIHPKSIMDAFNKWLDFTTQYQDAKRTTLVFSSFNTRKQIEISETQEGKSRYFDHRERGFQALIISWSTTKSTELAATNFAKEMKSLCRQDSVVLEPPRSLVNNMTPDTKLEEFFSKERIEEYKRIVGVWDPLGIFWRPWA
ncbi:hypothetical protein N7541_001163 [Penicillium brevicompactum]|uniref:FAD-binding PCMH-type domain-containing protein n=1 Tax=Penicillium brevicompactum TaxID=5074 RepID=A0A9W9RVI6_PENBR|nr:hypothetical protein N7541_001163 [Penicillium brevicompactum]